MDRFEKDKVKEYSQYDLSTAVKDAEQDIVNQSIKLFYLDLLETIARETLEPINTGPYQG